MSIAGAIESQVKLFKDITAKLAQERKIAWDEVIDLALMAMRSRKMVDFGDSPFELRFKRQMKLLAHLQLGLETHTIAAEREQEHIEIIRKLADEAAKEQKGWSTPDFSPALDTLEGPDLKFVANVSLV